MNEEVIEQARQAVSKYCFTCEESCCKKGLLNITTTEAAIMKKKKPATLFLEDWDGSLSLKLEPTCTFLEDNKCTIYEERPQACRKYPIYVFYKKVVLAPCPAVREKKIEKELQAIEQAGYVIAK